MNTDPGPSHTRHIVPDIQLLPRPGGPGAAFAAAVAQRGAQSVPMGLEREQLQRSLRSGGGAAHSGEGNAESGTFAPGLRAGGAGWVHMEALRAVAAK